MFEFAAPGVEAVRLLSDADPATVGEEDRLDLLAGWERVRAWVDGQIQLVLAAVARTDGTPEGWSEEQVATVLRLAPVTAANRLHTASILCERLPATLRLLLGGAIGDRHAVAVAEAADQLPAELAPALEEAALTHASEQTLSELKRTLRRTVLRLDPRSAGERHEAAVARRCVTLRPADHGMAELWALLPAPQARALYDRLTSTARTAVATRGERSAEPTIDQARADALIAAVLADPGSPATEHGRTALRPQVSVVVGLSTLLGADDEPGHLEGYGPIDAATARELAHDETGTWRRLLTDPAGVAVDYSSTRYRPPKRLRALAIQRYGVCTFPGCHRAGHRCDLDHARPHAGGGPTCLANIHPVCRRHHRLKHDQGWEPVLRDDGTVTWTSPSGRTHTSRPPDRWARPDTA